MSERRLIPTMAAWLLEQAERVFLFSHGWIQKADGNYLPPASYQAGNRKKQPVGGYTRSHAINSQKQYVYNARNGGTRVDPDIIKQDGFWKAHGLNEVETSSPKESA